MNTVDALVDSQIDRRDMPLPPLSKSPHRRLVTFPAEAVDFRGLPYPVWLSLSELFERATLLVRSDDLGDREVVVSGFQELESTLRGLGPGQFTVQEQDNHWLLFYEFDSAILVAETAWFARISEVVIRESGKSLVELALDAWAVTLDSAFGARLQEAATGPV